MGQLSHSLGAHACNGHVNMGLLQHGAHQNNGPVQARQFLPVQVSSASHDESASIWSLSNALLWIERSNIFSKTAIQCISYVFLRSCVNYMNVNGLTVAY